MGGGEEPRKRAPAEDTRTSRPTFTREEEEEEGDGGPALTCSPGRRGCSRRARAPAAAGRRPRPGSPAGCGAGTAGGAPSAGRSPAPPATAPRPASSPRHPEEAAEEAAAAVAPAGKPAAAGRGNPRRAASSLRRPWSRGRPAGGRAQRAPAGPRGSPGRGEEEQLRRLRRADLTRHGSRRAFTRAGGRASFPPPLFRACARARERQKDGYNVTFSSRVPPFLVTRGSRGWMEAPRRARASEEGGPSAVLSRPRRTAPPRAPEDPNPSRR